MAGSPNPIKRFGGVRQLERRLRGRSAILAQNKEAVAAELLSMGMANLTDVISWDDKGRVTVKPSSEIDDAALRAIKKVKVTYTRDGDPTLELELHDKVRVLQTLAKATGLLDPTPAENEKPSVVGIKMVGPDVVDADYEEVDGKTADGE